MFFPKIFFILCRNSIFVKLCSVWKLIYRSCSLSIKINLWLDLPCLLLNNLRIFSLYWGRSSEGIGVLSKLIDVLLNLIWCKIAKILPHTIFFRVQKINECRRIESFLQNLSHKHLLLFLKFQVSSWFYIFALLFCLHLCFLLHSFYLFHIFFILFCIIYVILLSIILFFLFCRIKN